MRVSACGTAGAKGTRRYCSSWLLHSNDSVPLWRWGEEGAYFIAISEALSPRMSQGLDTARSSSNVLILLLPKQFWFGFHMKKLAKLWNMPKVHFGKGWSWPGKLQSGGKKHVPWISSNALKILAISCSNLTYLPEWTNFVLGSGVSKIAEVKNAPIGNRALLPAAKRWYHPVGALPVSLRVLSGAPHTSLHSHHYCNSEWRLPLHCKGNFWDKCTCGQWLKFLFSLLGQILF